MASSVKERITKKCHSDPRVTIDSIHQSIIGELSESDKLDYYLDNGMLLDSYYSRDLKSAPSSSNQVEKSVLSYFQSAEPEPEPTTELSDKDTIDDYMSNIDDTYVVMNDCVRSDKCKLCGHSVSYELIDSELICQNCGYTEDIIINSEKT